MSGVLGNTSCCHTPPPPSCGHSKFDQAVDKAHDETNDAVKSAQDGVDSAKENVKSAKKVLQELHDRGIFRGPAHDAAHRSLESAETNLEKAETTLKEAKEGHSSNHDIKPTPKPEPAQTNGCGEAAEPSGCGETAKPEAKPEHNCSINNSQNETQDTVEAAEEGVESAEQAVKDAEDTLAALQAAGEGPRRGRRRYGLFGPRSRIPATDAYKAAQANLEKANEALSDAKKTLEEAKEAHTATDNVANIDDQNTYGHHHHY